MNLSSKEITCEEFDRQFEFMQQLKRKRRELDVGEKETDSWNDADNSENDDYEDADEYESDNDDDDYFNDGDELDDELVKLSKESTALSSDIKRTSAAAAAAGSNSSIDRKKSRVSALATAEAAVVKPIDLVRMKISKLENTFSKMDLVKQVGRPESYAEKPDPRMREQLELKREREEKELNLFSGIYSLKATFLDLRTDIPPPRREQKKSEEEAKELANKPKLVELYNFAGFIDDNYLHLPHGVQIDDVLRKVLNSIIILQRQPHYRKFLVEHFITDDIRQIVAVAFWWCFLERYKKLPSIQEKLFKHASNHYVNLIFNVLHFRYRDTFFKQLPNLIAMCVYTIFCSSFPESYTLHFNDDFREFVCELPHSWISGCKPTPRSYSGWNFKAIDPPSAVFAKQVSDNDGQSNLIDEIKNLGGPSYSNTNTNTYGSKMTMRTSQQGRGSRISRFSDTGSKKSKNSSDNPSTTSIANRRRAALVISDLSEITESMTNLKTAKAAKMFRSAKKKPSHPACNGPEFENFLFDLFGHSPLVSYYLYNNKALKINTTETLIRHPHITEFPPLNAPTYNDVIKQSVKSIRKLEKNIKTSMRKNQEDYLKLEKKNVKSLRDFSNRCNRLLSNTKEVSYISDIILLETKRDPNSASFNVNAVMMKSLKKHT